MSHSREPTTDRAIAALAEARHGVVTRSALLALGLDAAAIDYRVRVGRLLPLHRGVYAVGHRPAGAITRAAAALAACHGRTALSHRTAGAVWGFIGAFPEVVELTSLARHRLPGATVHRSRTLSRQDVTRREALAITTPARTLLDLAAVLDQRRLARAYNEARVLRRLQPWQVREILRRLPRQPGGGRLERLVVPGDAPTRSTLEDDFLALCAANALPRPEVNRSVAGLEVDMVWPEQRLVVELDGRAFHDTAQAFERDRERDATLLAAGYRVLRITARRLDDAPAREARRLAELLTGPPRDPPAAPRPLRGTRAATRGPRGRSSG